MANVIGVKFKEKGKTYYFDPKNISFVNGDGAIVETARGVEYGEVTMSNCEVDDAEIKGELKAVVRKATEKIWRSIERTSKKGRRLYVKRKSL